MTYLQRNPKRTEWSFSEMTTTLSTQEFISIKQNIR